MQPAYCPYHGADFRSNDTEEQKFTPALRLHRFAIVAALRET